MKKVGEFLKWKEIYNILKSKFHANIIIYKTAQRSKSIENLKNHGVYSSQ